MADNAVPSDGGYPPLRIHLLGSFRVASGARAVTEADWTLRTGASLVKLLALAPGRSLHREQVCDLLWPELAFAAAYNNLRYALHVARRTLAFAGSPLVLHRQILTLAADAPPWIDVEVFEEAVAAAHRSHEPEAYRAAIACYTGDLLPEDPYADWAVVRREALRESYRTLLVESAAIAEGQGEYLVAIEALGRVVAREPADEEAHAGLIRLYARAGQRSRAVEQYARLRTVLRREVDAAPTAETERLYAAVVTGSLPPAAPETGTGAPAPAPPLPSGLPAPLTRFIGRERERAEVAALFRATRLVTLTGAGGSGKTRLALAVAEDVTPQFPDGAFFIDLSGCADPALVPQVVAEALGLRAAGRSHLAIVREALHARQSLLILDNCEHLTAACAALTDALLPGCPGVCALATSREALRVPGEATWRIPPLSLPDCPGALVLADVGESEAVQLFVDRARLRLPAFALTQRNAAAVAAICRRLDGIPLALELAAARANVLTPQQLSSRLDDLLHLLADGGPMAPPRQRTLRATLDWSYALLDEEERTLLRRLAVFVGGCTLEAVEAICAGAVVAPTATLPLLAQLVDKSLVVVETESEEMRYRLLEVIRHYARERLAATDEQDAVQRRHAAYFEGLTNGLDASLKGPDQATILQRVAVEHDNFRAVLQWSWETGQTAQGLRVSAGLYRFWYARGEWDEGTAWLERLLSRGREEGIAARDASVWTDALFAAGSLAVSRGDYRSARALFEEHLATGQTYGMDSAVADALAQLGRIAHRQGDYARAHALLSEALKIRQALGEEREIAITLSILGRTALTVGELARARPMLEESVAILRRVGDVHELAVSACLSGYLAMELGKLPEARTWFGECLTGYRSLNAIRGLIEALEGCAILAALTGRPVDALQLAGAAAGARAASGIDYPPVLPALAHRTLTAARQSLGETVATAAWEAGREQSLDQAVADALQME
ncbi:MAG: tetratricopeptide repeat protein [Thermomicrobia bacterium]|nr:tetratricopeptide repeat protein [Thermomicrobia bacterium]